MPPGWSEALPPEDKTWISKALFTFNPSTQRAELKEGIDRLWHYPPEPKIKVTAVPRLDHYFGHRLFLWLPRRLWEVSLKCPLCEKECTKAGLHRIVRQVIDIRERYLIATEKVECKACKKKYMCWNWNMLKQLDIGHQNQFPAILTNRLACDIKVITLLRQRGLGNSATQLQHKLTGTKVENILLCVSM